MKLGGKHKHHKKKPGSKHEKPLAIKGTLDDVLKVIARAGNDKLKKKR